MGDAGRNRHVPHVVDHDLDRQPRYARAEFGQVARIDQQLDMPAERRNAGGKPLHLLDRDAAAEQDVDTDAAHAGGVKRFEFGFGHIGRDHRNAAQPAGIGLQGFDHAAVVGAVDADLDQHAARHAKAVQHAEIGSFRRRRRRVAAVGDHGETIGRPDHMGMGVAGARRNGEARRTDHRVRSLTGRGLLQRCAHGRAPVNGPRPSRSIAADK